MAERVCYIQMSELEYERIEDYIQDLKEEIYMLEYSLAEKEKKCKALYDFFNRTAIEESARKADDEFYNWCIRVADRYEDKDLEDWVSETMVYYNSPLYDFAERNNLHSKQEALDKIEELQAKKYQSRDVEPTEGWSSLLYRKHSSYSHILSYALDDINEREMKAEESGNHTEEMKYCNMWLSLYEGNMCNIPYTEWLR